MVKQRLLDIAWHAARLYVGSAHFDNLAVVVRHLITREDLSGAEKREVLIEAARARGIAILTWLLDLVIALVRARHDPREKLIG